MSAVLPLPQGRTEKMSWANVLDNCANSDGMELLRVQGVATSHRLYLLSIDRGYDRLVYVVVPEGGTFDFIVVRFPVEERDVLVWDVPDDVHEMDRVCEFVQHYVVDQGMAELRAQRL